MCGIVGSYSSLGRSAELDVVRAMRDRMVHRGPDGKGAWREAEGRCCLGHRRLSIIDLSEAAAQPMVNQSGDVVVAFNGEIYNHANLRKELEALGKYSWKTDHADTEVLLHAYEQWGLDCIDRFKGMFAFAIYDKRIPDKPVLHLVRDRIGIKPLYLSRTNAGEWLFASEIRALFAHPHMSPEMDLTALWHYLTFIVAPAPLTLFRGVFKIPAGHLVTIDHNGRAKARQYWDCRPKRSDTLTEKDVSEQEAVTELLAIMRKSIARRMVSDVPFGVLLSGGVDSSLNVALMSELMQRPVTTFTIGYEGKENFNEFKYARQVAKQYGTDHHEAAINRRQIEDFLPELVIHQDEPIADNVCIPLYFLAKLVADCGTTVVQVGEGADENFLGYWWCDHYRTKYEKVYRPVMDQAGRGWLRRLFQKGKQSLPSAGEDREIGLRAQNGQELFWGGAVCWWGGLRNKLTPDTGPYQQEVDCPVEGLMPRAHTALDSHEVVKHYLGPLAGDLVEPEVLQKITYMEHKLRLPEHLLMRVDKLTMAHSIEARVPFLDHEVVEFAAKLPPSYKLRDGVGKHLLKKAALEKLGEQIVYRKKQGFGAPLDEWLQEKDFGNLCLDTFKRSALCKQGLIDREYFSGLLNSHMAGNGGGYGFHIWTVLNAVLWSERWIEGRMPW